MGYEIVKEFLLLVSAQSNKVVLPIIPECNIHCAKWKKTNAIRYIIILVEICKSLSVVVTAFNSEDLTP